MFNKFWFEGNQAWGVIADQANVNWLIDLFVENHHVTKKEAAVMIGNSRNYSLEDSHNGMPRFGKYEEYTKLPTLAEHLRAQGYELHYDESVEAHVPY